MNLPLVKVSVVIPVFNCEATIAGAIDSALAQDFEPKEIIVVNDGSTDGTAEGLAEYGGRIRVIEQQNRGASAARNAGAAVSRGEFLAFLDADDQWLPGMLSRMVPALESDIQAAMVFSDYFPLYESGEVGGVTSYLRPPERDDLLKYGCVIAPSMTLIRRSAFLRCGGFCEEFKPGSSGEDSYMWMLLREQGHFAYVPAALTLYRLHSPAVLKQKYPDGRRTFLRLINERYGKRARPLTRRVLQYDAADFFEEALKELKSGAPVKAFKALKRSIRSNPAYLLDPRTAGYVFRRSIGHLARRLARVADRMRRDQSDQTASSR